MPVRPPCEDVEVTVRYPLSKFRGVVLPGDVDLGVVSCAFGTKTVRLDETWKGRSVDSGEQSPGTVLWFFGLGKL